MNFDSFYHSFIFKNFLETWYYYTVDLEIMDFKASVEFD